MKKLAFTLAELIFVMGVMGILSATAIHTFRSYDKGIKYLYSNTYHLLDRALYNATIEYITEDEYNREPFLETVKSPSGQTKNISATEGATRLCQALIQYINPVDRGNSCTASPVTASGEDSLFQNAPMFTSTNGIRFWISQRYPANDPNDTRTKFFIVYADLNGIKAPNSTLYIDGVTRGTDVTRDPDIFAFAALSFGRVCPLGPPEVEPRYLTTRIRYQDEEFNSIYTNQSKAMALSKIEAWGYYTPPPKEKDNKDDDDAAANDNGDDEEEDDTSTYNEAADNIPIDGAPLSYSGYVRSVIGNSQIYNFLSGTTVYSYLKSKFSAADIPKLNSAPISEGGFGCSEKSDDACEVLVDKYVY